MYAIGAEELSDRFAVRRLVKTDIPDLLDLMQPHELYFSCSGQANTAAGIEAAMHALPPMKSEKDKCYAGFFDGRALVAVLDLIAGYPDARTAYIGFFMVNAASQGRGLGSAIIGELCGILKRKGFVRAELAYYSQNPQAAHFWKKNGFAAIGETILDGRGVVKAAKLL